MLERTEFLLAFWDVGMKNMSEVELDKTLSYVDDDGNGFITFSEFLVACISPEDILVKDKIACCFKLFDDDNSGSISMKEIKDIIGKQADISDDQWNKLLQAVDADGDAELGLEEFSKMLRNIF